MSTPTTFTFHAAGQPASKGSYRPVRNPRTGRTVLLPMDKKEKPWRQLIAQQIRSQWHALYPNETMPKWSDALEVTYMFHLPRHKTVTRDLPTVTPDLDKLTRAANDAMTDSGLITDDKIIVSQHMHKRYATSPQHVGLTAIITRLKEQP